MRILVAIAAAMLVMPMTLQAQAGPAGAEPYSGDFMKRSTMTGDWFDLRNDLAAKGITFDASLTQVTQGVMGGGKDRSWEYGGRGILTGNLDTQKLGLWPGGFLSVEMEGNFEDAVNGKTGALMPVNTNQVLPLPGGGHLNMPQWAFAQFFSEYAGVMFGKLDTTTGDNNEFAHGKGDRQFINLALNINPTVMVAVPYSTLGASVIALPTKNFDEAIVNFSILQGNGTPDDAGFDELDSDKLAFAGEARWRTHLFGLTGHQLVGGVYSNKNITSLDQRIQFPITGKNTLEKETDTWAVYCNFDQYFFQPKKDEDRGAGVFGRFGASDGDPNPLHYFYSVGLSSKGPVPARAFDEMAVGFYYVDVQSPTLSGPLRSRSLLRDEWGVEVYYNVAITPWLRFTPDVQILQPAQERRLASSTTLSKDTINITTVLGARLQMIF